MQGLFDLPTNLGNANVQFFYGSDTSGLPETQTYVVPKGKSMLYIYAVGGGGGGGGGFSGIAGTARGGGGGGGSGGVSVGIFPLSLLPNILYMIIPSGGLGGAPGAGGNGTALLGTRVTIFRDTSATNTLLQANSGNGGGGGTSTSGGSGGTAGTVTSPSNQILIGLGLGSFFAGQTGNTGGPQTGGAGTDITIPVTGINVTGGAGGGGCNTTDQNGGGVVSIANSLISEARASTPVAAAPNASGGVLLKKPFFNFGGLGGGAPNASVGGAGGNGDFGCGGGGGGAGTTGGRGGNGGAGLVVMIAW